MEEIGELKQPNLEFKFNDSSKNNRLGALGLKNMVLLGQDRELTHSYKVTDQEFYNFVESCVDRDSVSYDEAHRRAYRHFGISSKMEVEPEAGVLELDDIVTDSR